MPTPPHFSLRGFYCAFPLCHLFPASFFFFALLLVTVEICLLPNEQGSTKSYPTVLTCQTLLGIFLESNVALWIHRSERAMVEGVRSGIEMHVIREEQSTQTWQRGIIFKLRGTSTFFSSDQPLGKKIPLLSLGMCI